jgi:hypothetical protein
MTIADIYLETRDLCDANSTTLTDATLLRRINASYEKHIAQIIAAANGTRFDDDNYQSLPTGTDDLVAGQEQYSFDTKFGTYYGVSVKDPNGNFYPLERIDEAYIQDRGYDLETYQNVPGAPSQWLRIGESVVLKPAPAADAVTLTEGLKVDFERTADLFTTAQVTAGTKEPGFFSAFHMILCYDAAIPYCMKFKKDRVPLYEKKAMEMEKDLITFYTRRDKSARKVISMKGINYR